MAFDVILRSIIMPVLLGQAFFVRRRVIQLPEPDGTRSGQVGAGPPLRMLIFGDSSAAGVGVTTQSDALLGQLCDALGEHYTLSFDLIAETGARTVDVLAWLPDLAGQRYDVVVTALGVNDVTKLTSARKFKDRQRALMDRITADLGAKLILVSGLPPMHQFPLLPQPMRWVLGQQAIRFDGILDAMVASRTQCRKIRIKLGLGPHNMSRDGFHPKSEVYAAWAQAAAKLIDDNQALLDADQPAP